MSRGTAALPNNATKSTYKLAVQLMFLVFMGGLIAASRKYLDMHLGIPGHTGLLWTFLMVIGCGTANRKGAGLVLGAGTALWGQVFGLSHGLVYNLALYSSVGFAMDLATMGFRMKLANPFVGLATGAIGHATKYLFIIGYAMGLGLPKHFLILGVATSLGYHLLFGAIGGLLGAVVLWRMRKGKSTKAVFDLLGGS